MQQRHNQKKGFNLIEAAIVLAVVGGVIGGIWGVASKIREDWQVQKVASDINLAVSNLRDIFKGLPVPSGWNNFYHIKLTPDSVRIANAGYWPMLPWKSGTTYNSVIVDTTGNDDVPFSFIIGYNKKSICIKLVRAMFPTDNLSQNIILIFDDKFGAFGGVPGYLYEGYPTSSSNAYNLAQTHCLDQGNVGFRFPR